VRTPQQSAAAAMIATNHLAPIRAIPPAADPEEDAAPE
jgi:hypothetical protein